MHFTKFGFLLFVLFSGSIGHCYGYDGEYKENTPISVALIDFSREGTELSNFVNITAESFKKAAAVALLNHGWEVTKITDVEVHGVIENYKAKIERANPNDQHTRVKIYITGPSLKQNWADNIRRIMLNSLVLLTD